MSGGCSFGSRRQLPAKLFQANRFNPAGIEVVNAAGDLLIPSRFDKFWGVASLVQTFQQRSRHFRTLFYVER